MRQRPAARRDGLARRGVGRSGLLPIALIVVATAACGPRSDNPPARQVGGGCDGCELMFEGMPAQLDRRTSLVGPGEPGERMEIRGIVYEADGKTPAPGAILYVYQTDAKGLYAPAPGQVHGRRHGRLRGWMKTSRDGEYQFQTIRPAPYPGQGIPAHIHPVVKEPRTNEYYLDDYVFDDDPLLTKQRRDNLENRGGSGIVRLSRDRDGTWIGRRDIVLGRNIPAYPSSPRPPAS